MDDSKYVKHFSEEGFWTKLGRFAKEAGIKVVYSGLVLYYALESPNTPLKAKLKIYGALGYLILPIDFVPDILPVVGFVDDLGVLGFAIAQVLKSIDNDVKQKAKDKLTDFFGEDAANSQDVIEVDAQIVDEEDRGPHPANE
jgi:uncharacterized membrane protein YkvA (DUF1232 family)